MSDLAPPDLQDRMYDCIVISDLHLGSEVCQARLLEEFLIWAFEHCRTLVINGDIFDDLNFKRLSKRHFACLKVIRRNSDRRDVRVVWVRGNHDGPAEIVSHIVGVDILDEYVYSNGRIQLLILHGDQFDTIVSDHVWLTSLAIGAFYYIQKLMPHRAARWIRRISKKFQRNSHLIERGATEYARSRGFRFVTCGHTHLPLSAMHDGVLYVNSGTWTETPPCPFVLVDGTDVRLEFWPLPSLDLDPIRPQLWAGGVSDRGQYRERNEDDYFIPGRHETRGKNHGSHEISGLFLVADGCGGWDDGDWGEQASSKAVEGIPREIARRLPADQNDPRIVQGAIREAVAQVNQELLGSSEIAGLGTTIVLALFRSDKVYVVGIGDSRAYRLRDGELERLTRDHTLARALVDAGTIPPEEEDSHSFKNVLFLCLGSKDVQSGPEDVQVMELQSGDRFLLATNGLTNVVSDAEIGRILGTVNDPQAASVVLKDLALANDTKDNVTCLVVHVPVR